MIDGLHLSLMIGPLIATQVPKTVIDDLVGVQVTNSADQRSGFQLTFAVGKNSPLVNNLLPAGYFDPPSRVIITVSLGGQTQVISDGVITRHEMTPSNEPGGSTLTITGVDISQMMDLIDFSGFPWPAMPPSARVAVMLAKYALYGIIPLVLPSVLVAVPNPLDVIPGQKGTDYQYIRQLADEVGYVFYIQPGPVPHTNTAYWGPEVKFPPIQPALTVNMDAHSNVESLTLSLDGISKTLYILYIYNKETHVSIPIPVPGITPLNPPLGLKPPLPLNLKFLDRDLDFKKDPDGLAKYNPVQAAARALARASQSSDVISGSGSLDVLRYGRILKARQLVGVRGAGPAYDGHYFVKSVTHDIKRGEYKQNFTLSRNALISLTSEVNV